MDWTLFDAANIVVLVAILVLFYAMLRYRRPPGVQQAERDLAYEWVAEPADRANPELKGKFQDVVPLTHDVTLIRLGFFNGGRSEIAANETVKPLAVQFPEGAQVLLARFGEAVKNDRAEPPAPVVTGARVEFPPFAIASGGVVVFDIAVRGARRPQGLEGAVAGLDTIRRLG